MHITVTPRIPRRNQHIQQLPSRSGSLPLRFCFPNLSYYQNTGDPFQVPIPFGRRPAALLPHTTTS